MRVALAALAALCTGLLAGCGGGGSGSGALTVFAASSLTDVFPQIDGDARFSFAGSDELAAQLRSGAKADVYAAASTKYPNELHDEGLVERPRVFATNRLVIIVPKGNPAAIRSLGDLARPGVRLVVGADGVPAGDYAREALAAAGAEAALQNVVSEEPDVKGIVGKVTLGAADAGIVYATDAKAVEGRVETIPVPADVQPTIEYAVAVVSSAPHPEEAAGFVDRLLGKEGQAELARAGFGPP